MSCTESDMNRLYRMVNNSYLADVKFLVGSSRKRIYAHRTLLASSSDVFKKLFNNKRFLNLHRNYPLIVVTDVDPDIFLDVLYYIYCDVSQISKDNVMQLFYASAKYQLVELQSRCEQFMIASTELYKWVQMFFDESLHLNLRRICEAEICAKILEVFENNSFLQLSGSKIRAIMELKGLQCTNQQLLEALDRWIEHQPESERGDIDSIRLRLESNIESEEKEAIRSFELDFLPYISGAIVASRDSFLYGLGIYTGVEYTEAEECVVTVLIEIGCCEKDVIRKSHQLKFPGEKRIEDCFFKRLRLAEDSTVKITVRITGMPTKLRRAWCRANRHMSSSIFKGDLRVVSNTNAHFVTPIAYLIYEPVEQ